MGLPPRGEWPICLPDAEDEAQGSDDLLQVTYLDIMVRRRAQCSRGPGLPPHFRYPRGAAPRDPSAFLALFETPVSHGEQQMLQNKSSALTQGSHRVGDSKSTCGSRGIVEGTGFGLPIKLRLGLLKSPPSAFHANHSESNGNNSCCNWKL